MEVKILIENHRFSVEYWGSSIFSDVPSCQEIFEYMNLIHWVKYSDRF